MQSDLSSSLFILSFLFPSSFVFFVYFVVEIRGGSVCLSHSRRLLRDYEVIIDLAVYEFVVGVDTDKARFLLDDKGQG